MSWIKKLDEFPEYVGDQPFPADLWGRAPIRGRAVQVVYELMEKISLTGEAISAGEIVDELIQAGCIPNEKDE